MNLRRSLSNTGFPPQAGATIPQPTVHHLLINNSTSRRGRRLLHCGILAGPFATGPLYSPTADIGADNPKPTLSAITELMHCRGEALITWQLVN